MDRVDVHRLDVSNLRIAALPNLGPDAVDSISVQAGLNQPPACTIRVQPIPNQDTIPVLDMDQTVDQYTLAARTIDNYLATRGTAPDFDIEFDAGQGGISFSGYLVGATPTFGLGGSGLELTVVGVDAVLDTLNMSVYGDGLFQIRAITNMILGLPLSGVLNQALSDVLASIKLNRESDTELPAYARVRGIADQNSMALANLRAIIGSTKAPKWDDILGRTTYFPSSESLIRHVRSVISSTGSYSGMGVVRAMCNAFGMLYVPNLDGPGSMITMDTALEDVDEVLDLEASQIQFPVQSKTLIRPRRSVVVGELTWDRFEDTRGQVKVNNLPVIGQFPADQDTDGLSQATSAPPWWVKDPYWPWEVDTEEEEELSVGILQRANRASLARARAMMRTYPLVLQYWAQLAYLRDIGNVIGAVISDLPLAPYNVGAYIQVQTRDEGKVICRGLISNVSHRMAVGGSRPEASTILRLSHVTMAEGGDD